MLGGVGAAVSDGLGYPIIRRISAAKTSELLAVHVLMSVNPTEYGRVQHVLCRRVVREPIRGTTHVLKHAIQS